MGKLFVAFVTFCKPLCFGSKSEDSELQKETKEAAALIPKHRGVGRIRDHRSDQPLGFRIRLSPTSIRQKACRMSATQSGIGGGDPAGFLLTAVASSFTLQSLVAGRWRPKESRPIIDAVFGSSLCGSAYPSLSAEACCWET